MKLEKNMTVLPEGFTAEGFSAGIKKSGLDLAVISSSCSAAAAGTFTSNKVRAACVSRNETLLEKTPSIRGIVVNSGNANACTGKEGIENNEKMADLASSLIHAPKDSILTASTGVIGVQLPIKTITEKFTGFSFPREPSEEGFERSSQAILTTDTFTKKASVRFSSEGKTVTLFGMAKGSGMIHPDMATMLSFICTDISIAPDILKPALKDAVDESFNMISVDGDTSTNDMVLILANGRAGNEKIEDTDNKTYSLFKQALLLLTKHLAKLIAADGEGATKLLEVEVKGAKTVSDARKIAKSVISSNLVKTAFFGMDPNWGRIIAAMGYSGGDFNPEGVSIYFQGAPGYCCLMDKGTPHHFDRDAAEGILKENKIYITINLSDGNSSATAWGCDLSYDYVKINAEYTT